jgi:hypothetical protein
MCLHENEALVECTKAAGFLTSFTVSFLVACDVGRVTWGT